MGFGYLFIGYLITFVLYITVNSLGFGGVALLLGYGVMFYALNTLTLYHRAFTYAKWVQLPLAVTALYSLIASLSELFLLHLPIVTPTITYVTEWITFLLMVFFNVALLYGIRMLAREVGLVHIAVKAVRNSVFVGLYAVLMLIAKLPILPEGARSYLTLPIVMLDVVWVVLNLLLLVSCAKNICPAGDEEQQPKRSRFEWINRIGDTYERNRQRAIDSTTQEAEEVLRRRQEKRNQKNHSKKKK